MTRSMSPWKRFERVRAWWGKILAALPEYERRNLEEWRNRGMRRAERELGLRNMELKSPLTQEEEKEKESNMRGDE